MSEIVTLSADEQAVVAAFWWQKVYFDGVPTRRWEVVPALAATPGVTEEVALQVLLSAEPADGTVVFDKDGDDTGWRVTKSGHHIHIGPDGEPDKGNPKVLEKMDGGTNKKGNAARQLLGQATIGDKVRGAVDKVKKIGKKVGKAVSGAEDRLNDAVEKGSKKAYDFIKDKGSKGYAKGKELAKKYAPIAGEKLKAGARAAGQKLKKLGQTDVSPALRAVKRVGGAAAGRIGSAIKSGLSKLWGAIKDRVTGAPRTIEGKIEAVKKQLHDKKLTRKLERLKSKLDGTYKKPAASGGAKAAPSAPAAPKAAPSGGGGGGSGNSGKDFHERMKAARAAKAGGGGKKPKRMTKPLFG